MRCVKSLNWALKIASASLLMVGFGSIAIAGSIQQPGLTTGLAEGYGLTEGFYSVTALNFGYRNTSPDATKGLTAIPTFITWSTPLEIADARVLLKAAPYVYVKMDAGKANFSGSYSPYYAVWLSWYLGDGLNLALGEGVQVGTNSSLSKATGRDYSAFQQNIALSYVKNNWNITGNSFFTAGKTTVLASQPKTANLDFTAIKRDGRMESGFIGYLQTDLNRPSTGYGSKQTEVAVGWMYGYLIGNQISVQVKLTTDIYQKNIGGRDTRLWFQIIVPIFTPAAPAPSRSPNIVK